MAKPIIAASILSADFARLGEEARAVEAAGADWLHVDVMDGRFVPPITLGADIAKAVKPHITIPMDVHLMVEPADHHIEAFAKAEPAVITIHPESGPHLDRSLRRIRELGAKAGVALNPSTPPDVVEWLIDDIDLVLVMSVNPGYGGQTFMTSQLAKIRWLREIIDKSGRDITLEVDGGVNPKTARDCVAAGADALVAGAAVFTGGPSAYAANIRALKGD